MLYPLQLCLYVSNLHNIVSSDRSSYSDSVLLLVWQLFKILSISANMLFFLLENWMQIDNNWPWASFLSLFLSFFSLFLSISLYFSLFLSFSLFSSLALSFLSLFPLFFSLFLPFPSFALPFFIFEAGSGGEHRLKFDWNINQQLLRLEMVVKCVAQTRRGQQDGDWQDIEGQAVNNDEIFQK